MNPVSRFFHDLTLKPQGATLVIAGFLPIVAIVSMFPIVASMIQHFAGDPDAAAKVPMMVTAPGLTIAILAPFAGFFVDKFGRRRLLLGCTFFYGVFGTAPFFLQDLDQIIATRLMLGVCEAGILTIVNTLIADYWDSKGRHNWLFLQGVVGPFMAAGVVLSAGLIASIRWNGGFLIYLVAFPIFLATLFLVFEPKGAAKHDTLAQTGGQPAAATPFPVIPALAVAGLSLFVSAIYYVFIVNGSIVFSEVGVANPGDVSKIAFLPSLLVIPGALLFRVLSNRPNTVQLGALLGVLGTGLTIMGMAQNLSQLIVGLCIQQVGSGMTVPALIAWAQTKFPFEHRGCGMGIWTGAFFLGQFVSPWFVHNIKNAAGTMQGAFLISGSAALLAMVIAAGLTARRRALAPTHMAA